MFKSTMIALALAFAGIAHADDTLDLHPAGCGTNTYGTCEVYNDGGLALGLSWNTNGTLKLSLFVVQADGSYALADTFTGNAGGSPLSGLSNVVLTDADGTAVELSGTFATRTTYVGSGRGQHRTTYVVFLGGELGV